MTKPKTILVVEDSEDDLFLFQRACRKASLAANVQIAPDGQAALEYLQGVREYADRQRFPLPDLILLDLRLPGISGHEVLQSIRSTKGINRLTVVILSSSTQMADVSRAYELGANSFCTKPSGPEELLELVQSLDRYWLKFHFALPAG
jgi:CheY-like chemotaxis protein